MHLTAEIWRKLERRQRLALALVAAECESRRRRDMSDRLRASSLAGFFLARRGGERRRATTLSWCRVVPPTPCSERLARARALCNATTRQLPFQPLLRAAPGGAARTNAARERGSRDATTDAGVSIYCMEVGRLTTHTAADGFSYLRFLPVGWTKDSRSPVLLFLHGSGGLNNEKNIRGRE